MNNKFSKPYTNILIATLNWNHYNDTAAFLDSCQNLTVHPRKILVVDNGSSDNSVEQITKNFPYVHLIKNSSNIGFASAANQVFKYALEQQIEFIFLANNDTLLSPAVLTILLQAMKDLKADIAAPAIFYANQPEKLWSLGGRRRSLTLEIDYHAMTSSKPFVTDFVTGCGILIRSSTVEKVGLFDEQFFMYYEDMDYCLRVHKSGGIIAVVPEAKMWHKVATSSGGQFSPNERYAMAKSSVIFFRKYALPWNWIFILPWRLGSALRISGKLILMRRWHSLIAYWKGIFDGLVM